MPNNWNSSSALLIIKQYAIIAEPLHKFLRGRQKYFSWDEVYWSIQNSDDTSLQTPLLALSNFNNPFILYTDAPFVLYRDASDMAVGFVLGKIQDGKECVVAYWSRQVKPA